MKTLNDIHWETWTATDEATLLFVVKAEQILLIEKKRGLGAGKINGPGGKLDPGETWQEAAIRETQEELCITPTGLVQKGELMFQFCDGYAIHCVVFQADDYIGNPTETPEAIPLWTPLDAIPYDRMWQDDRHWMPQMLAGKNFIGKFLFDDDLMLDMDLTFTEE